MVLGSLNLADVASHCFFNWRTTLGSVSIRTCWHWVNMTQLENQRTTGETAFFFVQRVASSNQSRNAHRQAVVASISTCRALQSTRSALSKRCTTLLNCLCVVYQLLARETVSCWRLLAKSCFQLLERWFNTNGAWHLRTKITCIPGMVRVNSFEHFLKRIAKPAFVVKKIVGAQNALF